MARDAHAWELLGAVLSDYEAAVTRLGLADALTGASAFRHELSRALEARAGRPGAARAGAVRVVELEELASERLALLVLIDANDGRLPSRGRNRAEGAEGESLHEGLASALRAIDPVRAPPSSSVRAARQLTSPRSRGGGAGSVVLARRSRDEEGCAHGPFARRRVARARG